MFYQLIHSKPWYAWHTLYFFNGIIFLSEMIEKELNDNWSVLSFEIDRKWIVLTRRTSQIVDTSSFPVQCSHYFLATFEVLDGINYCGIFLALPFFTTIYKWIDLETLQFKNSEWQYKIRFALCLYHGCNVNVIGDRRFVNQLTIDFSTEIPPSSSTSIGSRELSVIFDECVIAWQ